VVLPPGEQGVVGANTLTADEAAQIQALEDANNTQIDVVGRPNVPPVRQ
jgi:hypothetical protein